MISAGTYFNWVGRIERYTAAKVWLQMMENDREEPCQGRTLISQANCICLLAHHARSAPYTELQPRPSAHRPVAHRLRHAVVDLVIAHAIASDDFDDEMTDILELLHTRSLRHHAHDHPH